ncbi:MAG: homoserine kinase [Anaerolineales bacterium]
MKSVTIRVPASAANLGPGFDCLAIALDAALEVTLSIEGVGLTVELAGEGADRLPGDEENLVVRAARRMFSSLDFQPAGLRVQCSNAIPVGSGLGSSAAAAISGLAAASWILRGSLPDDLLDRAAELEGHADNAAAAMLGGLVLAVPTPQGWIARRLPIAPMKVAIATPDLVLPTEAMRQVLPTQVPLGDASFNLSHLGLALEAFRLGDYGLLATALQDRLHERHRAPHIPGLDQARRAAVDSGAAAAVLAGAGPSVLAFAAAGHEQIAVAMGDAFVQAGVPARSGVYSIADRGVEIVSSG